MPPRRVKTERGARESTARRSERPSQADDDDDVDMNNTSQQQEEEDDEAAKLERVLATIANYPDQPIDPLQEQKIRTIGTDITVHNQLYSQAIEAMTETAVMLADALPGGMDPFEDEEVLKIKASLLELLDKQHIVALHLDALDTDVRKPISSGHKIVDPASIFNAGIEKRTESYNSQTARQKYSKSKAFKSFVEGIWESSHDEAMPPVTHFLPKEDGDPDESDDDLEVGGVTQDYRCPLTLKIYTDPLTSTICGHSFSADAIREYVRQNSTCPKTGCDAKISLGVLKLDKTIQKKAIAAERREQKRNQNQDDTDIESD